MSDSSLLSLFENLKIEDEDKQVLVIDILNFGNDFLPKKKGNYWKCSQIKETLINVTRFIKLASTKYKLIGFIDAVAKSEETQLKWKTRRENEIIKKRKFMPHGWSSILGDMFKNNGVPIIYPNQDCDCTIATFAELNKGIILSRDKDMCKYRDSTYSIFTHFDINWEKKEVIFHSRKKKLHLKKDRDLLDESKLNFSTKYSSLVGVIDNLEYIRGVPSKYTKNYGNPHGLFEEAQAAIFAKEGISSPVKTVYPIFKEGKVIWFEKSIQPKTCPEIEEQLTSPTKLIEEYGNLKKEYPEEYKLAVRMVAYELSAIYQKKSLLDIYLNEEKKLNLKKTQ